MSGAGGGVLVHVLQDREEFNRNSLGVLAEAARLAPELGARAAAVVVGGDELDDERCGRLAAYGASRVFRVRAPEGLSGPVVDAMAHLMRERGFCHALFGGGVLGFEAGAALAARLDAGLCVEVSGLRVDAEEGLVARRPVLGDSEEVDSAFAGPRAVVVARLNAFEAHRAADGVPAPVEDVPARPSSWSGRARIVSRAEQRDASSPLEDAEVLVAGGRGLGGPEGFRTVKELADLLGGEVAATRAAVDAGWVPYSAQVGQTGKTVAPRLYVAAGVAGAVQQKVGMQKAKHILAINRDPDAPIFGFADFGVVGDLNKILPRLVAAIRARRAT